MADRQSKTAATLLILITLGAGPSHAQRLDGPEIGVDCQYGRGVLKLCQAGCRADADMQRVKRNNQDRVQRLAQCLDECWGIRKALEECPKR